MIERRRGASGGDRRPAPVRARRARDAADPPAADDGVRGGRPCLPGRPGGRRRRRSGAGRAVGRVAGAEAARRAGWRPRARGGAGRVPRRASASCSRRRACCWPRPRRARARASPRRGPRCCAARRRWRPGGGARPSPAHGPARPALALGDAAPATRVGSMPGSSRRRCPTARARRSRATRWSRTPGCARPTPSRRWRAAD